MDFRYIWDEHKLEHVTSKHLLYTIRCVQTLNSDSCCRQINKITHTTFVIDFCFRSRFVCSKLQHRISTSIKFFREAFIFFRVNKKQPVWIWINIGTCKKYLMIAKFMIRSMWVYRCVQHLLLCIGEIKSRKKVFRRLIMELTQQSCAEQTIKSNGNYEHATKINW